MENANLASFTLPWLLEKHYINFWNTLAVEDIPLKTPDTLTKGSNLFENLKYFFDIKQNVKSPS